LRLIFSLVCSFALLACNKAAPDLREWKASDHDHTSDPGQGQVEVRPDAGSPLAALGIDEVAVVAWEQNCAKCHGAMGGGDGPQAPMTHARDLTNPEWQKATSDQAIAQTIRQGRGRMPAFPLPPATIDTLVRLVRLFDASRRNAAGAQQQ
jgi:mono/diheme cytochrome c family protein